MARQGGVRIGAGTLKGRALRVPPGARPTESRVREALFDIVGPSVRGTRWLDLFAGSGAVGLEALSRGAASVLQVDAANDFEHRLRAIYERFGLTTAACRRLVIPRQLALLPVTTFDWIFADPPYDYAGTQELLPACRALLAPGGRLVIEHRSGSSLEPSEGLLADGSRRYGSSTLSFFRPAG